MNRCIMAGETVTGVTTMFTDRGVDTGDMLLRREVAILSGETGGRTHLAPRSTWRAEVLIDTLSHLTAGTLERIPQTEDEATYQPMLTKEDGLIDWSEVLRKKYPRSCAA